WIKEEVISSNYHPAFRNQTNHSNVPGAAPPAINNAATNDLINKWKATGIPAEKARKAADNYWTPEQVKWVRGLIWGGTVRVKEGNADATTILNTRSDDIWNAFFANPEGNDENVIEGNDIQGGWKASGLNPARGVGLHDSEADNAHRKGWRDLRNNNGDAATANGRITALNVATHTFTYASHGQADQDNINLLTHNKTEIDNANALLALIANPATTLAQLQQVNTVDGSITQRIGALADAELPVGLQQDALKTVLENAINTRNDDVWNAFFANPEGNDENVIEGNDIQGGWKASGLNPARGVGLHDSEADNAHRKGWRDLRNNNGDAATANGRITALNVATHTFTYASHGQADQDNINLLTHNKTEIDNANALLALIANPATTLAQLQQVNTVDGSITQRIGALADAELPVGLQQDALKTVLENAINTRSGFATYHPAFRNQTNHSNVPGAAPPAINNAATNDLINKWKATGIPAEKARKAADNYWTPEQVKWVRGLIWGGTVRVKEGNADATTILNTRSDDIWNAFFANPEGNDENVIEGNDIQGGWKASGLNPARGVGLHDSEADNAHRKGWRDLRNNNGDAATANGRITALNVATHTFTYASHGQADQDNINLLTHNKTEIDNANALLALIANPATTLAQLQQVNTVDGSITQRIGALADAELPVGLQQDALKTVLENAINTRNDDVWNAFFANPEGNDENVIEGNDIQGGWKASGLNPARGVGLHDSEADNAHRKGWRDLRNNNGDAATANGRITALNVATHTFTYASHGQADQDNINLLTHNKTEIDNANALLALIANPATTLAQLQQVNTVDGSITQRIGALADAELPVGLQQDALKTVLENAINTRSGFATYHPAFRNQTNHSNVPGAAPPAINNAATNDLINKWKATGIPAEKARKAADNYWTPEQVKWVRGLIWGGTVRVKEGNADATTILNTRSDDIWNAFFANPEGNDENVIEGNDIQGGWKASGLNPARGVGLHDSEADNAHRKGWRDLRNNNGDAATANGRITALNVATHTFTYASHGQADQDNINLLTHNKTEIDNANALLALIANPATTLAQLQQVNTVDGSITQRIGALADAELPVGLQQDALKTVLENAINTRNDDVWNAFFANPE
ncbi:hypothetical protein, partial [endosymbiont GvMRE of Glomus versiforme]|uniref:hypothetical protein n=1 Tax=endosymbiont GvMRE of Glomus versiforme TaxID=2039283 RepID=UPI00155863E4